MDAKDIDKKLNKGDLKEQTRASSSKITNFFPVLRAEGRAKMCSSKSVDKQKDILQKYASTSTGVTAGETTEFQKKISASGEIIRGGIKVSSALKTPLSQVLRKSIEASENKKDESSNEKGTEVEKKADTGSEKSGLGIFNRKAKKSFSTSASNSQLKKLSLAGNSLSTKAASPASNSEDNKTDNLINQTELVSNIKLLETHSISTGVELFSNKNTPICNTLDSTPKSIITDDLNASNSIQAYSKGKKNKKRHFRGGTYGLFLSKRKKKKKLKSSPDSKDDECSLAGTENSSYIDSDDGNSLVSDDYNTPSEKSLADDEAGPDSRNSPMLSFDAKNSSTAVKPEEQKKSSAENLIDSQPGMDSSKKNDSGEESATKILESLGEMQWDQDNTTETSTASTKNQLGKMLTVPQYDDISNESYTNSNSFPFNKESLLENIEDTEMFDSREKDDQITVTSNENLTNNGVIDPNNEISKLIDDLNSSISENKDEEHEVSSNVNQKEDVSTQEVLNISDEAVEQNTSDLMNMTPDSSKIYSDNDLNSYNDKEENDQLSTIATSVKSRQRIKRRFTDDVVDTEMGLLSVNSMLSSRKNQFKPEPLPPPSDILENFVPNPNKEAKMGTVAKLECIFSNRQPLMSSCTCKEDKYNAKLGKDKQSVYCQAVDSIDDKLVGCCNPVVTSKLVRPSVKVPFTIMCEMHLWRISHHHSCPYCGLFCSQGSFLMCSKEGKKMVHLSHKHCQVKEEGHVPFCLHCGDTTTLKTVELEMNMTSPPTFYLSQHPNEPIAKARITFSLTSSNKDKENDLSSDKVHQIVQTGKVLSSVGLPKGPNQEELDELIKILNSNKPSGSYTLEDFYISAAEGDISKMLDMLSLGFDPNQKYVEHEYNTPLHAASSANHLTIVHLLIQAGAINDSLNEKIFTPLMIATENNHKDIVHYLVRKGSLTDFRGENGMTSIHMAAKSGNLELLKILMGSRKIDVNAQDDGGWTAIVWASEHEHYDVVKYLLERGANPNIKDNEGNTGLHWSAFSGSSEICFLYLDYGCEIDAVNEHGDTPVHIAARQDKLACVTLFLSRGANVQIQNKANMLPAECCLDKNSQTYLQLSLNMLLKKITGKYQHKAEKILHRDISRGKEQIAIQCVNAVDEEPPPFNFLYVTENCETMPINIDRTITSLQSCHCEDDCTTTNCTCAQISFKCWYDKEGCLSPDFNMLDPPMLFECNRACSCWSLNCRNRILQNGITSRLQLVRTKGKGWGVRTLKDIPKGAFICEYVGELISDSEADKREDDSYLFDLDNRDGETYCLDARYYGNVSRFINHLCEPNLVPVKIFVDHQDLSFPRIAFFSSREIKQYEELGFDYGEKFWSIKYKWFTCDCGTPKCKYSKETIHETLANYYRRLKEEQLEETAHQATGVAVY